jgi:AraC-like DNA-binding protein
MAEQPDEAPLTFIVPAALPGTEIIVAKNCVRKWRFFHERYVICLCHKASANVRYRNRTHQASDGSYMFMEPGETHVNLEVPQPQDYTVLFVTPAAIEQAADELGAPRNPHFALFYGSNPEITSTFERLATTISLSSTALEQQSHLAVLVRIVLENCIEQARRSAVLDAKAVRAPVERAKMYLRERFSEEVTLDELASAAGLSRFHLLRAFAKHVGIPPHAYQVRVRIERARWLLRMGMSPVDAANTVGFSDQSHLTRHFKRVLYETPGAYGRVGA